MEEVSDDEKYFGHEIIDFLAVHGKRKPVQDDPDDVWTSPDAAMLESFAALLVNGYRPDHAPHSEWRSGGYGPYTDKRAQEWHDRIMKRCFEIIKER